MKLWLWQVAKFLEDIPSRLPFTQHPEEHLQSVEEFSRDDVVIYLSWLVGWFGFGVWAVARQNLLAGLTYLIVGPVAYAAYLYLACTKCPYHGKRCYMGGGQCAGRLFKPRRGDYSLAEDLTIPALWIAVSAFPVPLLIYYQSWWAVSVYLVLALGWQIFHKRNICSKCLNTKCGLNPRFVGRSGRVQLD